MQYIRVPAILESCRKKEITDAGSSMNPDIEKVIDMHPDGILLSPYEKQWWLRTYRKAEYTDS